MAAFSAPVSYVDYTANVDDLLTLCLTGFPDFDQSHGATPFADLRRPRRCAHPAIRARRCSPPTGCRDLATTGGVQVNAVITGQDSGALVVAGRVTPADARSPPARAWPRASTTFGTTRRRPGSARTPTAATAPESPDVPVLIALAAAVALAGWPMVQRR